MQCKTEAFTAVKNRMQTGMTRCVFVLGAANHDSPHVL